MSVTTTITITAYLRWRHNGGGFISKWDGESRVEIENVRVQDGGIYECHQNRKRAEGKHAIFQLVVRG